jgi:hypothetical protein
VDPKIGQTPGSRQPIGIGKLPNCAIYGVSKRDFSSWWEVAVLTKNAIKTILCKKFGLGYVGGQIAKVKNLS